jgi:hypothetical protein
MGFGLRTFVLAPLLLALDGEPVEKTAPIDVSGVEAEPHGALVVTDARALMGLEQRGFSLGVVLGAPGENGRALMGSASYRAIASTLAGDLAELDARPGVGPDVKSPNHPFDLRWLSSERSRFELIGVVHRLDRRFADPSRCGEVRLVYRLALTPERRPTTRLPMTVNVMFPQPGDIGGPAPCKDVAARWLGLPARGAERVDAIAALLRGLPRFAEIEIDVQNLHGPSLRKDEDDHAEYLLRAFEAKGDGVVPKLLFNTPRTDLPPEEREALRAWIVSNFRAIDEGTAVLPARFLAERAISVTPRGLARPRNRPYKAMFDAQAFVALPYADAKQIASPAALVRYLDETTCPGCHQSRSIAGFHLLGEERDPDAVFNALAVGMSPHFSEEIPWRARFLGATARGERWDTPRPFAEHARMKDDPNDRSSLGGGAFGEHCGLGDWGFAAWTCAPGLRCRDVHADEIGHCVPEGPNGPGDACQNASVVPETGPDGDRIAPKAPEKCLAAGGRPPTKDVSCSPNGFGFAGGLCSDACDVLGAHDPSTATICAAIPLAGFESDCFTKNEPIEACLSTHSVKRVVRACDAQAPCRDDFGCARVGGAPQGTGACVPPYFVFQARVDGPRLDR